MYHLGLTSSQDTSAAHASKKGHTPLHVGGGGGGAYTDTHTSTTPLSLFLSIHDDKKMCMCVYVCVCVRISLGSVKREYEQFLPLFVVENIHAHTHAQFSCLARDNDNVTYCVFFFQQK